MQEYFNSVWNSPNKYVIIFIGAIIVLYIPFMIAFTNRSKKNIAEFLKERPDAAKVYVKLNAVIGGQMAVLSVNDEKPLFFTEGFKQGFYILPGESEVRFTYSWSRPGVMYKSVTTTIGPVSAAVSAEANKSYNISYDKKAETCLFTEV